MHHAARIRKAGGTEIQNGKMRLRFSDGEVGTERKRKKKTRKRRKQEKEQT
jgi:hypothetical protein